MLCGRRFVALRGERLAHRQRCLAGAARLQRPPGERAGRRPLVVGPEQARGLQRALRRPGRLGFRVAIRAEQLLRVGEALAFEQPRRQRDGALLVVRLRLLRLGEKAFGQRVQIVAAGEFEHRLAQPGVRRMLAEQFFEAGGGLVRRAGGEVDGAALEDEARLRFLRQQGVDRLARLRVAVLRGERLGQRAPVFLRPRREGDQFAQPLDAPLRIGGQPVEFRHREKPPRPAETIRRRRAVPFPDRRACPRPRRAAPVGAGIRRAARV
ncbi:MAG: hypothetical protein R3F11_26205 [Verrucomicrobiales bacterium]